MKWLKFTILLFVFSSCNSYYYLYTPEDIYLYPSANKNNFSRNVILIPAGSYYYSTAKNAKFRKAKYSGYKGYAYNPYFDNPNYESARLKRETPSSSY